MSGETYYVVQRGERWMCPSDGNGGVIWLPVDHAYGHALRIIAACVAVHKAAT